MPIYQTNLFVCERKECSNMRSYSTETSQWDDPIVGTEDWCHDWDYDSNDVFCYPRCLERKT